VHNRSRGPKLRDEQRKTKLIPLAGKPNGAWGFGAKIGPRAFGSFPFHLGNGRKSKVLMKWAHFLFFLGQNAALERGEQKGVEQNCRNIVFQGRMTKRPQKFRVPQRIGWGPSGSMGSFSGQLMGHAIANFYLMNGECGVSLKDSGRGFPRRNATNFRSGGLDAITRCAEFN